MLTYDWIDHKREPRSAPDPRYLDGIDVNIAAGADKTCFIDLPYPARRCGLYVVTCTVCGLKTAVTTAGRRDDPRTLTVACKAH